MTTRNRTLALAVAAALALPVAAEAQMRGYDRFDRAPSFNYLEANYHRVDVDDGDDFSFSGSDGWQVGGSFQFWDGAYFFGEYSQADQDFDFQDDDLDELFTGDFDLVRWRVGVGYAMPFDDMFTFYGHVSWDRTEFNDLRVNGVNIGSDRDDGFGAEIGGIAALIPQIQLQGWIRYTEVGGLDEVAGGIDDDWLFGLEARWFVTQNFALQAGYEYGDISTWNAGIRFGF
jgi:opacity protein-like surface antigen